MTTDAERDEEDRQIAISQWTHAICFFIGCFVGAALVVVPIMMAR